MGVEFERVVFDMSEDAVVMSVAEAVEHRELADAVFLGRERAVIACEVSCGSCHGIHVTIYGDLSKLASGNCMRRDN